MQWKPYFATYFTILGLGVQPVWRSLPRIPIQKKLSIKSSEKNLRITLMQLIGENSYWEDNIRLPSLLLKALVFESGAGPNDILYHEMQKVLRNLISKFWKSEPFAGFFLIFIIENYLTSLIGTVNFSYTHIQRTSAITLVLRCNLDAFMC